MAAVMSAKRPRALTNGLNLGGGAQVSRVCCPFGALFRVFRLTFVD
jgi:hypothetical protein